MPSYDRYGRIVTEGILNNTPRYHVNRSTDRGSYYTPTAWERFSDRISDIGDWFQDSDSKILDFITAYIFPVVMCIGLFGVFIGAIVTWVQDGFWSFVMYVVVAMLVAGIAYYALYIVVFLFLIVWQVVIFVCRLIFTNGVTFLITVGVALLCIIGSCAHSLTANPKEDKIRVEQVATTRYLCTASTLNVRAAASTNGVIIGKFHKGDRMDVVSIENGWAKIQFNSGYGYVSTQYIRRL